MSQLFTEFEQLLGHYCQTRDGQTYVRLIKDVMPALTMSQEEDECGRRYRQLAPGQLTPFEEPRNPAYEEWKRTNCWRWYHFDHERDAEETLRMRLERDPECAVSRVPTMAETFRMGVEVPEGERPTTMRWKGYAPPPLLGLGQPPSGVEVGAKFAALFGMVGAAAGITVGAMRGSNKASAAAWGAAIGAGLGATFGLSGWWTA